MTDVFLGIDTGGSKSHALITNKVGRVLGFGKGGPGNWEKIGWDGTRSVLDEIISQATTRAGVERGDITAAGLGLAGFDWPEDRPPHIEIIHSLLRPDLPFVLVNDAFLGLLAGSDSGWGIVVAAGTSCNCYGRNAQGKIGRITGSSCLGEYAGARELVWWAIQAVARAWSLCGPTTRLSETFVKTVGAKNVADLLAGLTRGRYVLSASDAPRVFAIASQGDGVALDLVRRAGYELGCLAVGVSRQIGIADQPFDLVLSGSLYNGSSLIRQSIAERVHRDAPQARLIRLHAPPVVGAILLAMEHVGMQPSMFRKGLLESSIELF